MRVGELSSRKVFALLAGGSILFRTTKSPCSSCRIHTGPVARTSKNEITLIKIKRKIISGKNY
jgi:hypothetical protein